MRSVLEFAESFGRVALHRILDADDIEELVDALTEADVGAVYAGDEQSAAFYAGQACEPTFCHASQNARTRVFDYVRHSVMLKYPKEAISRMSENPAPIQYDPVRVSCGVRCQGIWTESPEEALLFIQRLAHKIMY